MYNDKDRTPGDHVCPQCNRGYWTLRPKQSPMNEAQWVIHACVFCIDNNAAKAMGTSYARIFKEHRSTEALDDLFFRTNDALTQIARFRARIRYLTED